MNILSIIEKLPEMQYFFSASEEDVFKAEKELNLVFADEYKKYLLAFGAVQSDIIAISGIIDDYDYNVVNLTKRLKLSNKNIPDNFYVIEDVGVDGLVIWQSSDGTIYQSIPNSKPVKIFGSLSEFLNYQIEE